MNADMLIAFLECGACVLPDLFPDFALDRRPRCVPYARPDDAFVAFFALARYGNEED